MAHTQREPRWATAGERRHQVAIETPVETPDGAGGWTTVWTQTAVVWAAITPLQGREALEARAVVADLSHTVNIRFRTGVTPACRIVYGGRLFRIVSVIDLGERHRQLELSCAEVFGERAT